jgi:nucleotide-binding universal stress UspA family protein
VNRNGTSGAIVCGVDGSETMPAVLSAGQRLAAAHDALLLVVHAFDEPLLQAQEVMAAIHRQTADDRHVEARLVEGAAADVLLELASGEQADWLVTGVRSGARQQPPDGSVWHRLARHAPCPLMVVPERASDVLAAGLERAVVCAVDGSAPAAAARAAGDLAARLRHRLVLVDAARLQHEAAARLSAGIEPGPPVDVLQAVVRRENGAAIVVARRGAGGAPAALAGSVTAALISSSDVPVVVLSGRAERRADARAAGAALSTPG